MNNFNADITEQFERLCKKAPGANAISYRHHLVTYAELDQKVSDLASYLANLINIDGKIIGVCIDSSLETATGILAVWKAGGILLPLHPGSPVVNRIISYCKPELILCTKSEMAGLPDNNSNFVLFDEFAERSAEKIPAVSKCNVLQDTKAVILYRFGNTGEIEEYALSHEMLIGHLNGLQEMYRFHPEDKVLFDSFQNLDDFLELLLPALLHGAEVLFNKSNNIKEFAACVSGSKVTHIKTGMNTWRRLIPELEKNNKRAEPVNCIISGTAPVYKIFLDRWRALFNKYPKAILVYSHPVFNLSVAYRIVYEEASVNDFWLSVNKPVIGFSLRILDEHFKDVPDNVEGWLFVWHNLFKSVKTLSSSMTNTAMLDADTRFMRTNSTAKYLTNGDIAIADKKCFQSVSATEITAIEVDIFSELKVDDLLIEEIAIKGQNTLVAYLVPGTLWRSGEDETSAKLYSILRKYNIACRYATLKMIPLTALGETDRRYLSEIVLSELDFNHYDSPENETEKRLSAIWKKLLRREFIHMSDDFFVLGGNSLQAIQLASRVSLEFRVAIGPREIMEHSSIRSLSKLISRKPLTVLLSPEPIPVSDFYPTSHAQKRLWLQYAAKGETAAYHISGAIIYEVAINVTAFEKAFHTLIERHEALRTTFHMVEGEIMQKIHEPQASGVSMEFIDLVSNPFQNGVLEKMMQEETTIKFDLKNGPLVKGKLIRNERRRFVFLLTMHHIVSDGWSVGVLKKEIESLYEAFTTGRQSPLLPLPFQYRDYVAWMNNLLSGNDCSKDRNYWNNKLGGDLPVLDLPIDIPRQQAGQAKAGYYRFQLDEDLTRDLTKYGESKGATLFMTLLALLKVLLYKYTRQNDIVVGSPVLGRNHPLLENQVGMYLNYLVLKSKISGLEPFKSFLGNVAQTVLEAFEHQLYPYDQLIEDLQIKPEKDRNPLYDVLVVMNTLGYIDEQTDGRSSSIADSSSQIRELNDGFSKVDLSFLFTDLPLLQIDIEYRRNLYEDKTIKKIAEDFKLLVNTLLASDNLTVNQLKNALMDWKEKEEHVEFEESTLRCIDEHF